MTRKIIIDCDPGIDDAVAICTALFNPRLEVLAITATAGTVEASRATENATSIVGQLDPPRYPRIGKASPSENAPVLDDSHLYGRDGLDVTEKVRFGVDLLDQLPAKKTRAGAMLHKMLLFAFRSAHQNLEPKRSHFTMPPRCWRLSNPTCSNGKIWRVELKLAVN